MTERQHDGFDLHQEISKRVSEWEQFAIVLGLPEYLIRGIRNDFSNSQKRSYNVMKSHCHPNEINNEWKYWKKYLEQFREGITVIQEMETSSPQLFMECQDSAHHKSIRNGTGLLFHQYSNFEREDLLPFDENREIKVNISSNNEEVIHYQNHEEFLQTKMKYLDTYTILQDWKTFDFTQKYYAPCNILKSIQTFLDETNDDGFVLKGYSFQNHYRLFGKETYPEETANNKILAYFANHNVLLHVKICDSAASLPKLLNSFPKEVQFAESVHECLRNSSIIHIGVVLINYKDKKDQQFCNQCVSNYFLLSKCIFTHSKTFRNWFDKVVTKNKTFLDMSNLLKKTENKEFQASCLALHKSIFCCMALKKDKMPTYCQLEEGKFKQLDKLVFLNAIQLNIVHSPHKHFVIRGGYGTGKSMVLQLRLDEVLWQSDDFDMFYYLCHDKMSKFDEQMKLFAEIYPEKNILVCNIGAEQGNLCSLSNILNSVKQLWKGKRIHLFIEEFQGASLSVPEVGFVKEQLEYFKESHIVIAAQSMEFQEFFMDVGSNDLQEESLFQYETLVNETSFKLYQLEYELRCSKEIHKFINTSIDVFECSDLYCPRYTNQSGMFADRELEMQEKVDEGWHISHAYKNKYFYNKPRGIGHNISSSKISLLLTNNKLIERDDLPLNTNNRKNIIITPFYRYTVNVENILIIFHYLLQQLKAKGERFVLSTYDSNLYNRLHLHLSHTYESWTTNINLFIESDSSFDFLLTDHGSLRGFEFKNLVFLINYAKRYLLYRLIECFSRATQNLFLIILSAQDQQFQIINIWKSLDCVECKVLLSDESEQQWWLQSSNGEKEKLDTPPVAKMPIGATIQQKFPWSKRLPGFKAYQSYLSGAFGLRAYRKILFSKDDPKMFQKWMEDQNIIENIPCYFSLMFEAALCNALEILKMLEKQCCIPHVPRTRTLLHASAVEGSKQIALYLLQKGFPVNIRDEKGLTPLHCTTFHNQLKIAEILIEFGAIVDVRDNAKTTPLHFASICDSCDVAKILIKHGADVNATNSEGKSNLHLAGLYDSLNVVPVLLNNHALINQQCKDGKTPLHYAAEANNDSFVFNISRVANVNSVDNCKKTPLFYAVENNNAQNVVILLENGADITITDSKNKTALDYALKENHPGVLDILRLYGKSVCEETTENITFTHLKIVC